MAPPGRTSFRGGRGGFRGRGAPRGRGFPRARGGGRGGKVGLENGRGHHRGPRFTTARIEDSEEVEESTSDDQGEAEDKDVQSADDQEDDDADEDMSAPSRPYLALMQSLASEHGAKRRKLGRHESEGATNANPPGKSTEPGRDHDAHDSEADADLVDHAGEVHEDGEPVEDVYTLDDDDDDDDNDNEDDTDAFKSHFGAPDQEASSERIKAIEQGSWQLKREMIKSSRVSLHLPKTADEVEAKLPGPVTAASQLGLKKKIAEAFAANGPDLDADEQLLAPFMFNYQDVLYCDRTLANAASIRRLTTLHALNHIFKTRDTVIKNNERLSKASGDEDIELRDQGFTRPKVLMLLPTRQSCVKIMDYITALCQPDQQENRKRFEDSYVEKHDRFSADKPADFRELFGGNDDDNFRLGLKFTRKTIKYFAKFYNSDIIFASPLGLRMAIGHEEEKSKQQKVDFDYLSSIELIVMDQADALLMQNWEHVEFIMEHLNVQPREAHGCDFSRVRSWYLDDQAKYYRQTLIFSAFNTPELAELFRTRCHNWAGKARLQPTSYPGVLQQILSLGVRARQTFSRLDCASAAADPDARFAYFTAAVLPVLAKRPRDADGTLVFVPSYLDFVRVRNYLATDPAAAGLSFGSVSEYADVPEASRARSHFLSGRHRVLLYTERAHHFRRYQIRGVKRIVMYGLPDNPLFYQEMVAGFLGSSEQSQLIEHGQGRVRVLFSKYDVMKVERVVGTERVAKLMQERGDTFDFV